MTLAAAEGLYCDPASQRCRQPNPEGGACSSGNLAGGGDCADPHDWCDATRHCSARLPVGAASAADQSGCVAWAACDPNSLTCVALPKVGERCVAGASPTCLGDATCDDTSKTCMLAQVAGTCL